MSRWFDSNNYGEIVNDNVTVLLKPVITHAKETGNSVLMEGVISLCCRWTLKQALTNAAIGFKHIGIIERKDVIIEEIKSIFKNDQQLIDAIIPCFET